MRRLYEKKEILFAIVWIIAYCVIVGSIRGNFGDGSIQLMAAMFVFAAAISIFVKKYHLEEKYGLNGWPKDMKKYLYFIPMWIISTGNLWDGISLSFKGTQLVYAAITMILVGYVEEMIFRGFLFKAMLSEDKDIIAIIVSSLTFGIGHIVNFFNGQASLITFMQIIFAISWGFVLTMVFYKSGSLIPCVIAHSTVDVSSLFGADSKTGDWFYIITTIVVAVAYSIYLSRIIKEE